MQTPISHVYFKAFFAFFFGSITFYFLAWTILASTVPEIFAVLLFGGATLLSAVGSCYFLIIFKKSDVYLPRSQSILFYSIMALFSILLGVGLYFHIDSYQAIPVRLRIPSQVLGIVVYFVFTVFSLMRVSEARFLPSLSKGRVSDELVK